MTHYVGVLSNNGILHAAPVYPIGAGREGMCLCGLMNPPSTPERRRWDPDHPKACKTCLKVLGRMERDRG